MSMPDLDELDCNTYFVWFCFGLMQFLTFVDF